MATKKKIEATPSAYTGILDTEFQGYDTEAGKRWKAVEAKQKEIAKVREQIDIARAMVVGAGSINDAKNWTKAESDLNYQLILLNQDLPKLQGSAQVSEASREGRGAVLKQQGVNLQAGPAAQTAIEGENLLVRNINQELQGRIAGNKVQAEEAKKNVGTQQAAALGQAAARAGQAGYSSGSGTGLAMSEAARTRYDADRTAIEGQRQGRENLLVQQGQAAAESATILSGAIDKTSRDWQDKSTTAITDVTGVLVGNVKKVAGLPGFGGDVNTPGVQASREAVGTALETWSFDSYLEALNSLTSRSVNKGTWDRLLLEKDAPVNPYEQYSSAISPLTPIAGTSSNLLAAAAGTPDTVYTSTLSGKKNTGSLI